MRRVYFILIGLYLLCFPGKAQRLSSYEVDLEAFIESLFPIQDEELDYEDIYEVLLQYYLNPLHLNKATAEELQSLYLLGPSEIKAFLDYRDQFGPLLSIYELQAIPGFSPTLIEKLLPFVTLEEKRSGDGKLLDRVLNAENKYLITRWQRVVQQRRGYTPPDTLSGGRISSRYAGDPHKIYSRFRASKTGDFSFGFTLEKDPGEAFEWNPRRQSYGFDFVSTHAMLQKKGKWESLILGDYQLQFGQGLLLGAGFTVGKGSETITSVRRAQTAIRPYTSAMEAGYFRGAAATYKEGNWRITAFTSRTRRSAGLSEETPLSDEEGAPEVFISSIRQSGFHRTPSEIAGKASITEFIYGSNITYQAADGRWMAGLTGMFTQYSLPLKRTDRLYNQFEFSGRQNINAGGYYTALVDNFNFFGEVAVSSSGGLGMVNGVLAGLSNTLEFSALHRKYDRDFHSFYGAAFGENSRNINEEGFYLGLRYRPGRSLNFAVYADRFRFPWLRFRVDAPSTGHEYLGRITYQPNKNILIYFQAREESKARNVSLPEQGTNAVPQGIRRNYILNVAYGTRENLELRSRLQWSTYDLGGKQTGGMTIVQDLNWQWKQWKLSSRFALFDTDDYDNRQYVFERNVLYAFSIPAYFGEGSRTYLMVQYKANSQTSFWFRWAHTRYTDRDSVGSGLDRIDGNKRTDLSVQIIRSF